MTSRDFCYWLQGFFEITQANKEPVEIDLDATQTEMIKRHLAMVFVHEIDPSFPATQQADLDAAHEDKTKSRPFTDGTTVPPHSHGHVPAPLFKC